MPFEGLSYRIGRDQAWNSLAYSLASAARMTGMASANMKLKSTKRRDLLKILFFMALCISTQRVLASDNKERPAIIEWSVPAEMSVEIQESLGFKGLALPRDATSDSRSPAVVYILIGAVALSSLADTLLKIYKDWKYGGIIVSRDARGRLVISNSPGLDSSIVILDRAKDAQIIFRSQNRPDPKEIINALSALLAK